MRIIINKKMFTMDLIYKHKITNQLVTIKKLNSSIAVFNLIKPYYPKGILERVLIDVCICNVNNLELINQ